MSASDHTHADHPHSTTDPPPKSTLFCPDCGHESHATEDWTVRETDAGSVLTCPVCDTDIATRNRSRSLVCP